MTVRLDLTDLPDDFYAEMGRVILAATALEALLIQLLARLKGISDHDVGLREPTTPGTRLVEKIRDSAGSAVHDAFKPELFTWLDEVTEALERRHAVAHSRWLSFPDVGPAGWRYSPSRDRRTDSAPTTWCILDVNGLRELTAELTDLRRRGHIHLGRIRREGV